PCRRSRQTLPTWTASALTRTNVPAVSTAASPYAHASTTARTSSAGGGVSSFFSSSSAGPGRALNTSVSSSPHCFIGLSSSPVRSRTVRRTRSINSRGAPPKSTVPGRPSSVLVSTRENPQLLSSSRREFHTSGLVDRSLRAYWLGLLTAV